MVTSKPDEPNLGNLIPLVPRASYVTHGSPGGGEHMHEPDLVVAAHLKHLKMLGQTSDTIYCRRRALARMTAALGKPLLEASSADLLTWRASLTVGPATVVAYVSHAREFYRWAVENAGLLEKSPAMRLPVPRLPHREPRPISEGRLYTAVTGARQRIRPWLVLAGWAGLRAREIAYLRRECVLDGQQKPELLIDARAAKGGTERLVPMSSYVLGELHLAGLPARGWVFRRRDGKPGPNEPWTISHLCNNWLHSLGYSDTLHTLRARFATVTNDLDPDLRMVQELLGHALLSTTARYVKVNKAKSAHVVEQLPVPGRHLKVVHE